MKAIITRPDCREVFITSLHNPDCRMLVFYGPGGVGKSTLLEALASEAEVAKGHAICDLRQFHPGVSPDMLGTLYSLCDSVERARLARFLSFDLAQQVFSAKTGQPPRTAAAGKGEFGWEMAGFVENIASAFAPVPGLGTGVQTAQLAYRAYRKLKPRSAKERQLLERYRSMQADELAQAMPTALAQDIEAQQDQTAGRRVLFLDNLERLSETDVSWLRQLIRETPSLLWVAFSRKNITERETGLRKFHVKPFDEEQRQAFWQDRLPKGSKKEDIDALDKLGNGLPFYMDLLAQRYRRLGPGRDWAADVKAHDLVERTLEDLTCDQREMVRVLSAARRFSPDLFRALFPGSFFWTYAAWFEGVLFEPLKEEGGEPVYTVRRLYADGVRAGCTRQLWREYHQRLFQYYDDCLTLLESAGPDPTGVQNVATAFAEFRFHAHESGGGRYYLTRLVSLSDFLVRAGQGPALLGELQALDSSGEAKQWCGAWGVLCCLGQTARLCLGRGRYADAAQAIRRGLELAGEETFPVARLHLLSQRMRLYASCPNPEPESAERLTPVEAGEACWTYLIRNAGRLTAPEAARYQLETLAFLGKQYLTVGRNEDAERCLEQAAAQGDDRWKAQAFGLYGPLALAQERLGELMSTQGERDAARRLYEAALESYTLAECTGNSVDCERMLDHGLAHKRMAENEFHRGSTEAGLKQLFAALDRYAAVRTAAPELVDLYCKTGWACMAGVEYLLSLPDWQEAWAVQIKGFFTQAEQAVKTGLEWEQDYAANPNSVEAGGRQLRNLRAAAARLQGSYLEGLGHLEEAGEAYRRGMEAAREAVERAPEHPYSHSGLAECALALARYLERTGGDPVQAAEAGRTAIERALELSPGDQKFLAVRQELDGLCARV